MAFYGPPSLMTFQLWERATWTAMWEAEKSTEGPVIQDPEIIDTARQSACLSPREIHRAHQWMLGKEGPSLMNVKSNKDSATVPKNSTPSSIPLTYTNFHKQKCFP